MIMRSISWAICGMSALLLVGSCQLDPYRIQSMGDGGVKNDGQWRDAVPITNDATAGDAIPDGRPLGDINYDACIAMIEACNNVDDNCNGEIDEGLDKLGDPRFCEDCKGCNWLLSKNAFPGCDNGACSIVSCKGGYIDQNKDISDGCEYLCTPTGLEVCDGIDNDCNNQVDDGISLPQNICLNIGLCVGTAATCLGAKGWQCEYPIGVELQPCTEDAHCGPGTPCDMAAGVCPGIVIVDEKKCDGLDGDCDGVADDPWASTVLPNALGKECDIQETCVIDEDCGVGTGSTCGANLKCTPKQGICRDVGQWVCDPVNDPAEMDGVICEQLTTGQPPAVEVCNNVDDNCDGFVDNLDLALTPDAEMWITVGGFQIFKFEASRPDATSSDAGEALEGRPCSLAGRLPWTDITKEEAQAACASMGARLCKTSDWEQACRGQSNTLYPYGADFDPATCNGRAFDSDPSTAANDDGALPTDQPAACVSTWPGGDLLNMSGNVKEWTATDFSGSDPTGYEIKGGAFDTPSLDIYGVGLSCDYDLPAPTSTFRLSSLGFRCCKTP